MTATQLRCQRYQTLRAIERTGEPLDDLVPLSAWDEPAWREKWDEPLRALPLTA